MLKLFRISKPANQSVNNASAVFNKAASLANAIIVPGRKAGKPFSSITSVPGPTLTVYKQAFPMQMVSAIIYCAGVG